MIPHRFGYLKGLRHWERNTHARLTDGTFGDGQGMIEALKDEEVINKVGGKFKLTSLIQHRVRELMDGSRPLVERGGRSDLEVAIQEIIEDKINIGQAEAATVGPDEDEL